MKFKKRIKFTDHKGYESIYPPSCEQALLYYYGYHKVLQAASGGNSSSREAAILVAEDVRCWWRKTGIKTKTLLGILYMITKLVEEYGALLNKLGLRLRYESRGIMAGPSGQP